MDITGNDGPKIKRTFTCKGCKWLGDVYDKRDVRSCLHPDVISQYKSDSEFIYKIFMGTLNSELKTPSFCPYLIKKLRYEKLKTIDDK